MVVRSVNSEVENWNIAQPYSYNKIAQWMIEADRYEILASFGAEDVFQEFQMTPSQRNELKIQSLKWFAKCLELVVENAHFAIWEAKQEGFKQYLTKIKLVKKTIPIVEIRKFDQKNKVTNIFIDEEKFETLLESLIDIKVAINGPLHVARLIYPTQELLSPEELKAELTDELINTG